MSYDKANNRPDNFQTPPNAVPPLVQYIPKEWKIYEPCIGKRQLMKTLTEFGYTVFGTDIEYDFDFLRDTFRVPYDCIVTNPPYSLKDQFLARCYELGKPFALLLPLTALEGARRQRMYRDNGIELILMNKRIKFATPSGKKSSPWFATAWFTHGLNLPNQLVFTMI